MAEFEHARTLVATPRRGGSAVDLGYAQVRELAEIAPTMGRDLTSLARLIVKEWLEAHGRENGGVPGPR